jgi:hypothetical protein
LAVGTAKDAYAHGWLNVISRQGRKGLMIDITIGYEGIP